MTALSFKRKVNFHVVVKFAQGRAFFLEFGRSGLEMNNNNYIDKQLYLGIDGGGSKCRAVIYCDDEGVIADAISGPANVLRGAEKAQQHIIEDRLGNYSGVSFFGFCRLVEYLFGGVGQSR